MQVRSLEDANCKLFCYLGKPQSYMGLSNFPALYVDEQDGRFSNFSLKSSIAELNAYWSVQKGGERHGGALQAHRYPGTLSIDYLDCLIYALYYWANNCFCGARSTMRHFRYGNSPALLAKSSFRCHHSTQYLSGRVAGAPGE